ncbi:MAG TPA: hypothetical protein VK850_14745 [Candidatus Binatia bacterium]|nr:hypothetical protein [Candidatus Binatia bacterium]
MKLLFIADEFKLRRPVQQLLDRFLMGYPFDGSFHRPDCEIVLVTPQSNTDVERRIKDFGLRQQSELPNGDGALIFGPSQSSSAPRRFVYGVSAKDLAGTAIRGAWLLPNIFVSENTRLAKALAIVQGEFPSAEMEALDVLMPLIWRKDAAIRSVVTLGATEFWPALLREFWPLVKSALSRSDSPQGDAVRDGRTQDLVGLGLLENLVKSPRGWLVEHEDGIRYVIAVMDGAVADYNVALQTRAGGILSAQIHRGPPPGEHHYDPLAAMLERYFRTGEPPWPPEQSVLSAELMRRFYAVYGERKR